MSSNDFIDVLKRFEFRKSDKEIIIKFLKATNCYFQPTDCIFYLKLLRQMTRRVSNFNKLTNTFEYIKPLVNNSFMILNLNFLENFPK